MGVIDWVGICVLLTCYVCDCYMPQHVIKNSAGFMKIHLQSPHKNNIALLKGECTFAMETEDGGEGDRQSAKRI